MLSVTRSKLISPVEVACLFCNKQCVKAKIPGKVYFETFITFLLGSNLSHSQLGLGFRAQLVLYASMTAHPERETVMPVEMEPARRHGEKPTFITRVPRMTWSIVP